MSNDCSSELPCAGKENNANLLNALPRKTKLKPPFGLPDSALIELSKRNHKLRLQQCEESIPTFCDWKKSDNGPQILLDIPKAAVYRDKVERKLSVRIHKQQPMIPKHNRQLKKFFELETCRLKRADSAKKEQEVGLCRGTTCEARTKTIQILPTPFESPRRLTRIDFGSPNHTQTFKQILLRQKQIYEVILQKYGISERPDQSEFAMLIDPQAKYE